MLLCNKFQPSHKATVTKNKIAYRENTVTLQCTHVDNIITQLQMTGITCMSTTYENFGQGEKHDIKLFVGSTWFPVAIMLSCA